MHVYLSVNVKKAASPAASSCAPHCAGHSQVHREVILSFDPCSVGLVHSGNLRTFWPPQAGFKAPRHLPYISLTHHWPIVGQEKLERSIIFKKLTDDSKIKDIHVRSCRASLRMLVQCMCDLAIQSVNISVDNMLVIQCSNHLLSCHVSICYR